MYSLCASSHDLLLVELSLLRNLKFFCLLVTDAPDIGSRIISCGLMLRALVLDVLYYSLLLFAWVLRFTPAIIVSASQKPL